MTTTSAAGTPVTIGACTAVSAADRPRALHAVVLGGGTFTNPANGANELLVGMALTRVSQRTTRSLGALRVSVLPTARATWPSFDRATRWASTCFGKLGIRPNIMHVPGGKPTQQSLEFLSNSDLICIPGGNLLRMLQLWEKWEKELGFVSLLYDKLLSGGTELIGDNAGLNFLGTCAHADFNSYSAKETPWNYELLRNPLGGLYGGAWCPHGDDIAYDYTFQPQLRGKDTTRRDLFHDTLEGLPPEDRLHGISVDNHTALIIDGNDAVVVGSGVVMLHLWEGDQLNLYPCVAGESINLSLLDQPVY